jgi:hypothetical protein
VGAVHSIKSGHWLVRFKRCSAPDSHPRHAQFVALSAPSDKLNLGDSDRWIYALVSLSRAAFEFLTLAVRGSPIPRIKTLNLEGASVSASGSFTDMATRQRDGRFIPKSGQRVRPRSKD